MLAAVLLVSCGPSATHLRAEGRPSAAPADLAPKEEARRMTPPYLDAPEPATTSTKLPPPVTTTTEAPTTTTEPARAPTAAASRSRAQPNWEALRFCESGDNYSTNTGNGYYGAYQFSQSTWQGLGYGGLPSDAEPSTQDEAAERLFAARGISPWPVCGRLL